MQSNRYNLIAIIIGVIIISASFVYVNRSSNNYSKDNAENIQTPEQKHESEPEPTPASTKSSNSSDIYIQSLIEIDASTRDVVWILKSSKKTYSSQKSNDQYDELNTIEDPLFNHQSNKTYSIINKTNVILISLDGFSRQRFNEYKEKLSTISNLIEQDWVQLNVTNYANITQTRNGHATMLSGYLGIETGLYGNHYVYNSLPFGKTFLEKAETKYGSENIATGFIAGKYKMIYPAFNESALRSLDFVHIKEQPPEETGEICITFLEKYGRTQFVAFMHFRDPDKSGHKYTEGSDEWQNSLYNVDEQLSRIFKKIHDLNIQDRTIFYITTDHGFPISGRTHPHEPYIWLLTNDNDTIMNQDYSLIGLQDIAPTICYALDLPYNHSSNQVGQPLQLEYPQEKSKFRKKYLLENTQKPSIDILHTQKTESSLTLQVQVSSDVNQLFLLYDQTNFADSIVSQISIPLNTTKITLEIDGDIINKYDELYLVAYDFSENYSSIQIKKGTRSSIGDFELFTDSVYELVDDKVIFTRANTSHVPPYNLTLIEKKERFWFGRFLDGPYSFANTFDRDDLEMRLSWTSDTDGTISFAFWFHITQNHEEYSCKLIGYGTFTFDEIDKYDVKLTNAQILRRKAKGEPNPKGNYEYCWPLDRASAVTFSFTISEP
jgi:hypothetical protein